MKIVLGLGNPGHRYQATRHNVGVWATERVAEQLGIELATGPGPLRMARTWRHDRDVVLCCPTTYMNRSGTALEWLDPDRRVAPADILVVHDDLDLPPGSLRIRAKGSDGGHRGVRSIIAWLGTEAFPRLKLGVGTDQPRAARDFVLAAPPVGEQKEIDNAVAAAARAVISWLDSSSLENLMSRFNRRPAPPPVDSAQDGSGEHGSGKPEPPPDPDTTRDA